MGGLSLADALALCELLANTDPARYECAALRWLERFIDERLPPTDGRRPRRIGAGGASTRQARCRRRNVESAPAPSLKKGSGLVTHAGDHEQGAATIAATTASTRFSMSAKATRLDHPSHQANPTVMATAFLRTRLQKESLRRGGRRPSRRTATAAASAASSSSVARRSTAAISCLSYPPLRRALHAWTSASSRRRGVTGSVPGGFRKEMTRVDAEHLLQVLPVSVTSEVPSRSRPLWRRLQIFWRDRDPAGKASTRTLAG